MRFDCNVEAMSRTQLEAAYFNAVDTAETLLNEKEDISGRIQIALCKEFGLCIINGRQFGRKQDGQLLAVLMKGQLYSTKFLAEAIRDQNKDTYITGNHIRVLIHALRKAMACLEIHISTVKLQGYVMDTKSITNLQSLINKHNNNEMTQ